MSNNSGIYMLCEDGTVVLKVDTIRGKYIGNVKDNSLWEDVNLAPRLMKLCKQNKFPHPKLFYHRAERVDYSSKFELKSVKVAEGDVCYTFSEDLLRLYYVSPLGVVPEGLIEEFNEEEAKRKKAFSN